MATDANAPPSGDAAPWWAGLPEPRATCESIENVEVMSLLEETIARAKHEKRNFLLVDVRRNDWDGGTVATSINLPAQSFFQTRPVVYQLCKQAGIERIIFYCGKTFEQCSGFLTETLQEVQGGEVPELRGGCRTT